MLFYKSLGCVRRGISGGTFGGNHKVVAGDPHIGWKTAIYK